LQGRWEGALPALSSSDGDGTSAPRLGADGDDTSPRVLTVDVTKNHGREISGDHYNQSLVSPYYSQYSGDRLTAIYTVHVEPSHSRGDLHYHYEFQNVFHSSLLLSKALVYTLQSTSLFYKENPTGP